VRVGEFMSLCFWHPTLFSFAVARNWASLPALGVGAPGAAEFTVEPQANSGGCSYRDEQPRRAWRPAPVRNLPAHVWVLNVNCCGYSFRRGGDQVAGGPSPSNRQGAQNRRVNQVVEQGKERLREGLMDQSISGRHPRLAGQKRNSASTRSLVVTATGMLRVPRSAQCGQFLARRGTVTKPGRFAW